MAFEIATQYSTFNPTETGFPLENLMGTAAPGTGNDGTQGFAIGSIWVNQVNGFVYKATGVGTGAATWSQIGTVTPGFLAGSETLETWERRVYASF